MKRSTAELSARFTISARERIPSFDKLRTRTCRSLRSLFENPSMLSSGRSAQGFQGFPSQERNLPLPTPLLRFDSSLGNFVRGRGFEPPCLAALPPQGSASASFATRAAPSLY